jgi:hypothetical protein
VRVIDATHGHLVRNADDQDRDLFDAHDARRAPSGHEDLNSDAEDATS